MTEFLDSLNFLWELFKRDLKKKYYKSVLGVLWTLLNPLLMMLVMTLIFSTLFRRSIEHYPVYYLCAYILLNFNNVATSQALGCLPANGGLLRKIHVPAYLFCLSTVAVNGFTLVLSLVPLLVVALFSGLPLTPWLLLVPFPLLYVLLFTTGLSLLLSTVGVFFRDMTYLYGIITTVWTYLTPMFYPLSIVPERFRFLWEMNPLYHYVEILRDLVLYQVMPASRTLLIATGYSLAFLGLGVWVFRRYQDRFYVHL